MKPMASLSICIPRIEKYVSKKYITLSFKNIGNIISVDIVNCSNGYKKAFVHFTHCYNNEIGTNFKNIINNGDTVKFVHSRLGWFWKCSKSRSRCHPIKN